MPVRRTRTTRSAKTSRKLIAMPPDLIGLAMEDPSFRRVLLQDPSAAWAQALGVSESELTDEHKVAIDQFRDSIRVLSSQEMNDMIERLSTKHFPRTLP